MLMIGLVVVAGTVLIICSAVEKKEKRPSIGYEILKEQYPLLTPNLYEIIVTAGKKNKIDPATICALIDQESQFTRRALSPAGAVGYMQLMPDTAKDLNVIDRTDPVQNINGGTAHLAMCLRKSNGNIEEAFKKYHGGHNRKKMRKIDNDYAAACMKRIERSNMFVVAMR